jgi:phosphatidylglycerophosphate synthase
MVNFILGLWGCFLVVHPAWWVRSWGAFLVQANSVFDGCDGEIARLKVTRSRLGAWLDTIVDDVLNNAMFLALCIGLYRDTGASWIIPWGGAALLASFGISFYLYYFLVTHRVQNAALFHLAWQKPSKGATSRPSWFDFIKPILKRDFIIFVGMICIFLDWRKALLIGFMLPLFAGFVLYSTSFVYGLLNPQKSSLLES